MQNAIIEHHHTSASIHTYIDKLVYWFTCMFKIKVNFVKLSKYTTFLYLWVC